MYTLDAWGGGGGGGRERERRGERERERERERGVERERRREREGERERADPLLLVCLFTCTINNIQRHCVNVSIGSNFDQHSTIPYHCIQI